MWCPSLRWRSRQLSRTCSVLVSSSRQRRLVRVLVANSVDRVRLIDNWCMLAFQSPHRNPAISPRHIPVVAVRCNAGTGDARRRCSERWRARWRPTFPGPGAGVRSRSLGAKRHVLAGESLLGGLGERASHDEMNFVDGLGGEPVTVLAAGCGERCVEVVEVFGADRPERVLSDGRGDVSLDHPPVPVRRWWRGLDVAARAATCWSSQVVAQRHRVSSTRDPHTVGFRDARRDCFCVSTRCTGCVPSTAFATGGRIDPVVSDDIETTVAGNDVSHAGVIGT